MDSSSLVATSAMVLAAMALYYHIKKFSFWSSRGVPGPMPWPLFGTNIYYLFAKKLEVDARWHAKYGKTIGLYEGYSPLLRTTDNELIKHVWVRNFSSFADRNSKFIMGKTQLNWLLWAKGKAWANKRALVSPMFSSAKMRLMFAKMSHCVDRFLCDISARLSAAKEGAEEEKDQPKVQLDKRDVSSMTLDVIASCFFGLKLNTYDKNSDDEFLKRALEFANVTFSWFIVWLMTPRFVAKLIEINLFRQSKLEYFIRLSQQVIDERRANNDGPRRNDIIQAFLDARIPEKYEQVYTQEDDKEAHYNDKTDHQQLEAIQRQQSEGAKLFRKFEDFEIRGQMTFLFLAGFETTATTLSFAMIELAHQPEVQAKIYAELKEKFAPHSELWEFDFSTANYSDLLDCHLLDAFLSESLRLYSPILEHNRTVTAKEGAYLNSGPNSREFHLPQGTAISNSAFLVQRHPDYFDNPNQFDLTRFLPENRDQIKSCTFLPFGAGPRHCVAMRFALLEIKLALAKIISRHHVAPGHGNNYPPTIKPNSVFLQTTNSSFTLTPRA